jgi:hypothetical protein
MLRICRYSTAALVGCGLLLTGCASTGSTLNSGVADRFFEQAPYYAGVRPNLDAGPIAHVPITYQRGGSQSAMFDPASSEGKPIAALLAEMNAYLDSLGMTTRLSLSSPITGIPPDVHFGCETDIDGECTNGPAAPFDPGKPKLRLAVGRASADWTPGAAQRIQESQVAYALLLTLEVGQYWVRQQGILGKKVVELGTAHTAGFAWLTSLETPVSVLQITGALVNADGRVVRIGAEGLIARRTGLLASAVGAQALITDKEVEEVRTRVREDLPGKPVGWRVALRTLVGELTGRG